MYHPLWDRGSNICVKKSFWDFIYSDRNEQRVEQAFETWISRYELFVKNWLVLIIIYLKNDS